jgi:glycosyltransferase involved in cell wall biosynthesis
MKVLFLTKYGQLAASTRHRYTQFVPFLEQHGIECHISPLLDDEYLRRKFATGRTWHLSLTRAFITRIAALSRAHRYDLVLLHCEVFPYLPSIFERYLKLVNVPYYYDYDDAIFHQYDRHPNRWVRRLLRNKVRSIMKGSDCVLAGNEYLASYARKVARRVHVLPTVVDTSRYTPKEANSDARKPFTIGWIGSPSTALYLQEKAEAFEQFCSRHRNSRVVAIGSGPVRLPGVPLEIRQWREEAEVDDLREFDVGVMPLPDTPWAWGKSGFKLIQYMACGLPVIASPIGTNRDLVDNGRNGFLATTDAEWVGALEKLIQDPALRAQMGKAGLEKVISNYSLQVAAPRLLGILTHRCLKDDRNGL